MHTGGRAHDRRESQASFPLPTGVSRPPGLMIRRGRGGRNACSLEPLIVQHLLASPFLRR